jgi:phage-related protein
MTDRPLKDVHWHGDSLAVVRKFPRAIRVDIGSELYLLQLGEKPLHSRPFANVGRGVWEIRIKDRNGAFRVFYVVRRRDGIHVLHAFQKKTQRTRKSDIDLGRSRYQGLQRNK